MPAHRQAGVLQLRRAALALALVASCGIAHAGLALGALGGAGEALSDYVDQQMANDAALEQIRLHHALEMQRMQREFELQQQARDEEQKQRARLRQASLPTLWAWLQTQPASVQALYGSSNPAEMTLLLDLYKRDLAQMQQ